jgi:sulfatase maturation enzyme AslB (radical SAM superfamily)
MPAFEVLEPAIDPNNRISFLLDWELTMKCNLDCSYCGSGLYGGHDNSTQHPPKEECVQALEFMFEYADQYMQRKPSGLRYVVLNVYGGESLHHPDIVEILAQIQSKYQPYQDRWHLTITTTTNAIVSGKKLLNIIPYIDEFTVSYHCESSDKQKDQFKENLLAIKQSGKRLKCIVMMHNNTEHFQDSVDFLSWLNQNQIRHLAKQIDSSNTRVYTEQQIQWFNSEYQSKTYGIANKIKDSHKSSDLSDVGRACCGGRQSCINQNYKERQYYILDNKFPDWYCSVNEFFLFVKQVNGEVYVNKDCKMRFDGTVGPIGNLSNANDIINELKNQLVVGQPAIQCKIPKCRCGLCAPKAKDLDKYKSIMKKYQKVYAA